MPVFTALRLCLAISLVALAMMRPAAADEVCTEANARGVQSCSAGLSAELVKSMYIEQAMSRWCWAASLSMALARYGYRLEQDDIVESLHGAPVSPVLQSTGCRPASAPAALT